MATEKNIIMKQFNGTDYDTLYPKTIASQIPDVYSKTDTITAKTLSRLGLSADKLPNDAFRQIKTLIDNVQSSADSKTRIQTGSYVGTGTSGPNNSCSLTFDFVPKFLIVLNDDKIDYIQFVWAGGPYAWSGNTGSKMNGHHVSVNDKTISWYDGGAESQLNASGNTYHYVALG